MYDTQGGYSSLSPIGLPPLYHSQGWPTLPNYD
jgi:hypothetical protein